MREKVRGREPMMTADQAREQVRSPLDLLIKHHVDQGASQMRAYERVGSLIGRTPAWVQRIIGRREDATVGLHDAFNIRAAYERLCARVEHVADAIEAGNQELRRELDAALGGDRPGAARPGEQDRPQGATSLRPRAASLPAPVPTPTAPVRLGAKPARDLTDLPLFRAADPRP